MPLFDSSCLVSKFFVKKKPVFRQLILYFLGQVVETMVRTPTERERRRAHSYSSP